MSKPMTRPVPERIQRLKEELFLTETEACFERAMIVTQSYQASEGEHPAIRRAKAIRDVFRRMPLFIRTGELIVGQRCEKLAGRAVYPEYNLYGLNEANCPDEIWQYWHGRSIADLSQRAYPERLKAAEKELACGYVTGAGSGYGHVIVDYEKAINRGFRSIQEEAAAQLENTSEQDGEGRVFLQAVIIAAGGIIDWAERYADLALDEATKTTDPVRRKELADLAKTCRRVPAEPARNLTEALQSFWFVHLAMHIEQYGWSISAGRFDQYIFPYFQSDLASGRLQLAEAWELVLSVWVKFMENVHGGVGDTVFQNLTLGGQDIHGHDQSNPLSVMCLDATIALRFNQPALSVRWHPGIDPSFWNKVLQTIAVGMGLPALFNDTVIMAALTAHGVAREDAVGYGLVGCVEASVPGQQMGMTAGGHLNCAKALELALNQGRSMISGSQIGIETMNPDNFNSFEDLWQAYRDQVEYLSGLNVLATHLAGEIQKQHGYCPLMSSLLDDCLANRRDMVYGGTRYNLSGVAIFGSSNTCDSMMAIQKWIYDEGKLTWPELRKMLLANYKDNESTRLLLANKTPRYGNDLDEVDALHNRINALHADFLWKQVDSRNGRYTSGIWPVNGHVDSGHRTAATPDGRFSASPLVDGVGACQGADRHGPTALLKSVAKLNNIEHWPAGNTCNIRFPASVMQTAGEIERMRDLVTTFMELGGQELQINVVDAQVLEAAMANPESYRDLIVRVAGYSAYFTQLNRDVQLEVLSRTEQQMTAD